MIAIVAAPVDLLCHWVRVALELGNRRDRFIHASINFKELLPIVAS